MCQAQLRKGRGLANVRCGMLAGTEEKEREANYKVVYVRHIHVRASPSLGKLEGEVDKEGETQEYMRIFDRVGTDSRRHKMRPFLRTYPSGDSSPRPATLPLLPFDMAHSSIFSSEIGTPRRELYSSSFPRFPTYLSSVHHQTQPSPLKIPSSTATPASPQP